MKLARASLLFAVSLAFAALAHAGEVFLETFKSEALGRDYMYSVYVPDDYAKGEQRNPILYLLHGVGGNEVEWLQKGGVRDTRGEALQFMNARIAGTR